MLSKFFNNRINTSVLGVQRAFSSQGSKGTVSFFGLGNMGQWMAANLHKAGYTVYGFDTSQESLKNAKIQGIKIDTPRDQALKSSDYIITMLPNSQVVKGLVMNEEFLSSVNPNSIIIDSSTIDPSAAKEIYAYAKSKKRAFVDAPVSGGVVGAEKATLAFMVGAESPATFERINPLLKNMGANITNCESVGGGQIAKTCNNMALSIQMIAVAEALAMGKKLGLDPKKLAGIMSKATGRCWSVDTYPPAPGVHPTPVPADRDYQGGFATELLVKDLGIAMNAAKEAGADVKIGKKSFEIYQQLVKDGHARRDFSIIYKTLIE